MHFEFAPLKRTKNMYKISSTKKTSQHKALRGFYLKWSFGTILTTPPIARRVMVQKYRQVFWLKRHHSSILPGNPVDYCRSSSFTAAGPHRNFTCFPFNAARDKYPKMQPAFITYSVNISLTLILDYFNAFFYFLM